MIRCYSSLSIIIYYSSMFIHESCFIDCSGCTLFFSSLVIDSSAMFMDSSLILVGALLFFIKLHRNIHPVLGRRGKNAHTTSTQRVTQRPYTTFWGPGSVRKNHKRRLTVLPGQFQASDCKLEAIAPDASSTEARYLAHCGPH